MAMKVGRFSCAVLVASIAASLVRGESNDETKRRFLSDATPALAKWKTFCARMHARVSEEFWGEERNGKRSAAKRTTHELARHGDAKMMIGFDVQADGRKIDGAGLRILAHSPNLAFEVQRKDADGKFSLAKIAGTEAERSKFESKIVTISDNTLGRAFGFSGKAYSDFFVEENTKLVKYVDDPAASGLKRVDYEHTRTYDGQSYMVAGTIWFDPNQAWRVTKFAALPYPKEPERGRWDGSFVYEGEIGGLPKLTRAKVVISGPSGVLTRISDVDWSKFSSVSADQFTLAHYGLQGAEAAAAPARRQWTEANLWILIAVCGIAMIALAFYLRRRLT